MTIPNFFECFADLDRLIDAHADAAEVRADHEAIASFCTAAAGEVREELYFARWLRQHFADRLQLWGGPYMLNGRSCRVSVTRAADDVPTDTPCIETGVPVAGMLADHPGILEADRPTLAFFDGPEFLYCAPVRALDHESCTGDLRTSAIGYTFALARPVGRFEVDDLPPIYVYDAAYT